MLYSTSFWMKGFYFMSNENRSWPLPETVYGHRLLQN
jgi:hypothetical protein